jgi:hypothetical protein
MVLKSSKKLIGQLIADINLDINDIEHRLFEWINDAIDIMDITKHYVWKREFVDVEEGLAELPCGMDFLHSIWIRNGHGQMEYLNLTGSPLIFERGIFYETVGLIGSIEGHHLRTAFRKGRILVIYKGPPCDCDGYPMIPKSAKLDEALTYYLIQRLALKGYQHPIIKFEDARNIWLNSYVGAASDVEWFTLPELEEFSRFWGTVQVDSMTDNLYIN